MARVLAADDQPDLLQLITLTLELDGHHVIGATNGAEAVERATAERPDVIVLDVMMPKVDGLTALRRLQAAPETSHIPVLLLSAKTQNLDVQQGMEAGATGYISKPFEPDDLLAEVEQVLAAQK